MKPITIVLFASTLISSLVAYAQAPKAATENILYSFCSQENCTDGEQPSGVFEEGNTLYGTTYYGGTGACYSGDYYEGCGTIFSLDLSTGNEGVLHSFSGGTDGEYPDAGLDGKSILYGATSRGGYYGAGTAFSVGLKKDAEKVLFAFGCCSVGYFPEAGPVYRKGELYGAAQEGGIHGAGTVFSMDPKTGAITVLYSFCSQESCTDGAYPEKVIDVGGLLYGIAAGGGANGRGAIFTLDPDTGAETVLYSFCGQENCTDGYFPQPGLTYVKGMLYGTTEVGGAYGYGTVFSLNLNSGAETVLHSFEQGGSDGWEPVAGVIDVKGTLYGVTYYGGSGQCYDEGYFEGCGAVFSFDLETGVESVLYSFQGNYSDGENPDAALINVNGTLYGTTAIGGRDNEGTVFSITP